MFDISAVVSSDILRPKSEGLAVNVHVVQSKREPGPDFAAMNRVIHNVTLSSEVTESNHAADSRHVPKKR